MDVFTCKQICASLNYRKRLNRVQSADSAKPYGKPSAFTYGVRRSDLESVIGIQANVLETAYSPMSRLSSYMPIKTINFK